METIPFIHLFSTQNKKYAYDVNSNEIVELNDIIYDYLHFLLSGLSKEEAVLLLYENYGRNECDKYIVYVDEIRNNEILFSCNKPKSIKMFCCNKEMKHYYENYIQHMTFEVTQQCNMNCKYCTYSGIHEGERLHNSKMMSWETAKKGLDFMFRHGGYCPYEILLKKQDLNNKRKITIGFYGGEPLLNYGLIQRCVSYIYNNKPKEKDFRYTLTTNGILLDEEKVKYLIDSNFNIVVSIDGPPAIHDRCRVDKNGQGTHQKVIKAIQRINDYAKTIKRKEPIYYTLNCVMVGGYHIRELFEYFLSLEKTLSNEYAKATILINNSRGGIERWNKTYPNNKLEPIKGIEELVEEYRYECIKGTYSDPRKITFRHMLLHTFCHNNLYFDLHGRTRFQFSDENKIPDVTHPGSICKLGARRPYMTADGSILPCERVPSANPLFCIGNADNGIDLAKVQALNDEFTNSTYEDCQNCWCFRMCHVNCINNNFKNGSFDESIKKRECMNLREKRH